MDAETNSNSYQFAIHGTIEQCTWTRWECCAEAPSNRQASCYRASKRHEYTTPPPPKEEGVHCENHHWIPLWRGIFVLCSLLVISFYYRTNQHTRLQEEEKKIQRQQQQQHNVLDNCREMGMCVCWLLTLWANRVCYVHYTYIQYTHMTLKGRIQSNLFNNNNDKAHGQSVAAGGSRGWLPSRQTSRREEMYKIKCIVERGMNREIGIIPSNKGLFSRTT